MHAISLVSALRQLAMLGALSTGARDCDTTNVCSVARWHGVDLHNNTIRITLTSKSVADRLSTYSCGRDRFFEVFLDLTWRASRSELREICEKLVKGGFSFLHIHGISSLVASHHPFEFDVQNGIVILHDYPWAAESDSPISLVDFGRRREYGFHSQRQVDVPNNLTTDLTTKVLRAFYKYGYRILDTNGLGGHLQELSTLGIQESVFSMTKPVDGKGNSQSRMIRAVFLRKLSFRSHVSELTL